ncbi:hypothetical protein GMORB2_4440 [Geosmithia morbida]|uniref:DUF7719 domain-containing protein n=1 Tax=Geosmithia morbida TaxID=1094350 RepID=A0A9P4YRN6_9HYPO|nr:uncharacterized protein GMORB2_4440 [Geosmithia morbida]KAF4119774.1 hypothetical protein GMORB2_4440 [Geosmithia morbida]
MARKRELRAKDIKLQQPDRSGPTGKTLLDLAQERSLFAQADEAQRRQRQGREQRPPSAATTKIHPDDSEEAVLSPGAERFLETLLWTVSLAMMHFTFDVLVHHQFGREMGWMDICVRTSRAWIVFLLLFWPLHPHHANDERLLPARLVPSKKQDGLIRHCIFFAAGTACGCYLVYITNTFGYLAVMKQAPPLGCIWVWSIIEMDLVWAVTSLGLTAAYLWQGGYSVY